MRVITQINGIALHYARSNQFPYGSRGIPAEFSINERLYETLQSCFAEMFDACPLGPPEIITSAGIFVDKPNSYHRFGRAFDFDACFWGNYNFITRNFLSDPALYIAMESYLRRHFGIVLNYYFNRAHEDHWHIDNSAGLGFSTRQRSKILYLQMALSYIYKEFVVIDGIWGPQTAGATQLTLARLGLDQDLTFDTTWLEFLRLTGQEAFRQFTIERNPKYLLDSLYATILDVEINNDDRQSIVNALNNFRQHQATANWLSNFPTS